MRYSLYVFSGRRYNSGTNHEMNEGPDNSHGISREELRSNLLEASHLTHSHKNFSHNNL